jgi:hypothetical protein
MRKPRTWMVILALMLALAASAGPAVGAHASGAGQGPEPGAGRSDDQYVELVGRIVGEAYAVAVQGIFAYVVEGHG